MIKNCFVKFTLFSSCINLWPYPQDYIDPSIINKIQQLVEQLYTAGRIYAVINIQDFIKLLGEEVKNSLEDLIEIIAELYAGLNRNTKTDEEVID